MQIDIAYLPINILFGIVQILIISLKFAKNNTNNRCIDNICNGWIIKATMVIGIITSMSSNAKNWIIVIRSSRKKDTFIDDNSF